MMTPRNRAMAWVALVVGLTAVAAARPANAQQLVQTKDPEHPLVLYADSLLSLNDRCIVRGGALNPGYKPVYVNGKPIGFC
ncbi:MAG: hypothetical protein AAB011_06820 [Candidatus Eisenbacteria bacterium]